MQHSRLARLVSALSIALIGMGGGSLPVLDGLLFHSRGLAAEASVAHFEASSGCHADGCAIKSTAQHVRLAPALGTPGQVLPVGFVTPPARSAAVALSRAPSGQPLSRAPPSLG
ncbi:MAG TPA: hypothetical protein VL241_04580 [Gemmatimonadales bacterium]|nr:hypothetical protein [Gemmatimonadales bacterium]